MSAGLHHFRVTPVHADLAPLGIKLRRRDFNATYQVIDGVLWKEIGTIFVNTDGPITVSHVADALPREVGALAGEAENVWRGTVKPSKATGWTFQRRKDRPNYWYSAISVPADTQHDATAAQVEALHSPSGLTYRERQARLHSFELAEEAAP